MALLDLFKYNTIDDIGDSGAARRQTAYASDSYTKNQKEAEIADIKKELQTVENELDAAYMQVGRKFMERAEKTNDLCGLEIDDILRFMRPKLEKKHELENRLIQTEKGIREINLLREKEKAELEYQDEKNKLDKALAMDVLTQQEYEQRISAARRKADNFEEIRRVNQQFDMKLITAEQRDERIKQLTS